MADETPPLTSKQFKKLVRASSKAAAAEAIDSGASSTQRRADEYESALRAAKKALVGKE